MSHADSLFTKMRQSVHESRTAPRKFPDTECVPSSVRQAKKRYNQRQKLFQAGLYKIKPKDQFF
ncbi:hypothetical protein DXD68_02605 [Parabacteroides sp. TM07-1AC]|nr:hypothetical protein DXD68_02605 [Parabacteroides sp. TM07-1AC]